MGSRSHCPIGVKRWGSLSSRFFSAACRDVRLNAHEQSSWKMTALPCSSCTFSIAASMSLFKSSIADFLPMANSVSPTVSFRLVSAFRVAERDILLRVVPTVMGLTLPFDPLRSGVT